MSSSRLSRPPQAGFWETWLPALFGDFIIVIRLIAYVLLLCAIPSLIASQVSEILGTVSAIFLTSIYIFFQMDIFEQSVVTPLARASDEVEDPSSPSKQYAPSVSPRSSNMLRRTCALLGKFIDNKKNLLKEIADNFLVPFEDNESTVNRTKITGPEIIRKKFKILFFLVAATLALLILFVPGVNALGPIAISKYLISKAIQAGIARFATALLYGGAIYALRAPLVAIGVVVHYCLTKDPSEKTRLLGISYVPEKRKRSTPDKNETSGNTLTLKLLTSPPGSPSSSSTKNLHDLQYTTTSSSLSRTNSPWSFYMNCMPSAINVLDQKNGKTRVFQPASNNSP